MIPQNIITRMRQQLHELRPSERKVAETILGDLNWAINASIEEIAKRAEVSQPSVTRFCRAIDAPNLKQFKIQLAQNLALNIPYQAALVSPTEDTSSLVHKVCNSVQGALTDLCHQINNQAIDEAANVLAKARRICCIGVGSGSGLVAQDASLRFNRLNMLANAYNDGHLQRLAAGLLEESDVLFAISLEGKSEEINESVIIAREQKAKIIALTSQYTPLDQLADIGLYLPASSHGSLLSPGVSRLMQLVVIDMLGLAIAMREDPIIMSRAIKAKERLKQSTHKDKVGTA